MEKNIESKALRYPKSTGPVIAIGVSARRKVDFTLTPYSKWGWKKLEVEVRH